MNNIQEEKLNKKERYLLKREQKEKERLQRARQKKIRKILFISLPIFLLIGGISFGLMNYFSRERQEKNQGTPKIEINPLEYDVGTISMAAGSVKKTYEIKNSGDGDLVIDSIWTSCHCTTARFQVGEKKSPEFGMDKRTTNQKIALGETGFLEVTFDPTFHGPQGTGPAVRAVYLSTNDPQNKKVEVRLVANVVQ